MAQAVTRAFARATPASVSWGRRWYYRQPPLPEDGPAPLLHQHPDFLGSETLQHLTPVLERYQASFRYLPGDYVVHAHHGIGRFVGLAVSASADDSQVADHLHIAFRNGIVSFPAKAAVQFDRFADPESKVTLSAFGGTAWANRKKRVAAAVEDVAEKIVSDAAHALVTRSSPLSIPPTVPPTHPDMPQRMREYFAAHTSHTPEQFFQVLCNDFPYPLTTDQQIAVNEVLDDMAKPTPMRRLVVGDVGFGKTEVALRAAAAAVLNGRQVAVLAPTTLLAHQHFLHFSRRMQALPWVSVAEVSRMVSGRRLANIRSRLRQGSVQVLVGTHAILHRNLSFHQLGLVIVDEEQRFGVMQKEALRELDVDVHELTLTATPIPRTLQMSLLGLRSLSLIATPPMNRKSIITDVITWDIAAVRRVLLAEKARGGQSFLLTPRVNFLEELQQQLSDVVPEVSVCSVHGKMIPTKLEKAVKDFGAGEFDVLLCTPIIEAGLDFPNANTMIVHRADLLGLAQLYQIRGRVGRSDIQAYAYFTMDASRPVSDRAAQSLYALKKLSRLGDGFKLAAKDMAIRGTGNLLGTEQSGPNVVGPALYQRMLDQALVAARKRFAKDEALRQRVVQEAHQAERNSLYGRSQLGADIKLADASLYQLLDPSWRADPAVVATSLQLAQDPSLSESDILRVAHSAVRSSDVGVDPHRVHLFGPFDLFLPSTWIDAEMVRLVLYHRILGLAVEPEGCIEVPLLAAQLTHDFGPLPVAARNLLLLSVLNSTVLRLGITEIFATCDTVRIRADDSLGEALLSLPTPRHDDVMTFRAIASPLTNVAATLPTSSRDNEAWMLHGVHQLQPTPVHRQAFLSRPFEFHFRRDDHLDGYVEAVAFTDVSGLLRRLLLLCEELAHVTGHQGILQVFDNPHFAELLRDDEEDAVRP